MDNGVEPMTLFRKTLSVSSRSNLREAAPEQPIDEILENFWHRYDRFPAGFVKNLTCGP